ncbi:hypothetical protein KSS93_16245 [Pseudomonas xanthosomatis]|uniref:hypothetical protein n=1 Tax=Pseudomonas xanthosomatis TaxID=2842356 RepID=UPI001C3DD6D4|nr:hypothetical protein [Pseudomonas xanthosomatis]QXH44437.1 hypothetical protein KSS93_16245 [Pseudomonas xanthosomatis]
MATVGTLDKATRFTHLLLAGCALGSALSLPAHAGDGRIIVLRDVQPRMATRAPLIPDPNPLAINANPSAAIVRQTGELSDGDFAGISSGAGVNAMVLQQTSNLGGNINSQTQLPNMASGRGSGSGASIANMVNSSVQRGMSGLNVLTGGK